MNKPEGIPLERSEFEKIFRQYYQPLCRFSQGIVKDMDVAEEIVQDFFFHFWNEQQNSRVTASLKAYLFRSVYNNSLKHLRKQEVRERYIAETMESSAEGTSHIIENIQARQLQEQISQILDALPERCSTIFKMSRYQGLTYNEIAEALSISVKTVEANMGKALAVFRTKLKQYKEFSQN